MRTFKREEEGSQNSRSNVQKFKCYYNDEEGHMNRDCLKRKDLRDEKPLLVGVTKGSNLFNGGNVFLATSKSPVKSYWILDLGCLFHICSIRVHFDTYQPCEKNCHYGKRYTKFGLIGRQQYGFTCLIG